MVKGFLKNNSVELFLFFVLFCTSCFFIFNYPKHGIHLYVNQYVGNRFADTFFYYITYLGDGLVAVFILLIALLYNVRLGIYTTTAFLTASLFSIGLKRWFFDDVNRPYFIFKYIDEHPLKLVEGVAMYIHNSFPSGHATQAFSIFMCFSYSTKKPLLKLVFFFLAVFTAISRIYLSQHWLVDITAGSLIGMLFSILFYFIFIHANKLEKLNKPIFELKKN